MGMASVKSNSIIRRVCFAIVEPMLRWFWCMKVTGAENLPDTGPLIIASNHVSWFDGPVLVVAAGGSRCVCFLTKIELFRIPILGWFLRSVGMLPVDRRLDVGGIRSTVDFIRAGGVLGLFPEGTRSRTGSPGKARAGIGFLARESRAPVVPARLVNTGRFFCFRPVEVRFGPALGFAPGDSSGSRLEIQAFADAVMERIIAL